MGATITLQNNDTSYGWADGTRQEIVAGYPVPADPAKPHLGRIGREEKRVLLSKNFQNPRFCHLSTNATGLRISLDTFPIYKHGRVGMLVYIGQAKDLDSPLDIQY